MKKKRIGMDSFKIRIDLTFPQPTKSKEPENVEDLEEECPDHNYNMRNNPIPDLINGKPVVDSEYIRRTQPKNPKPRS